VPTDDGHCVTAGRRSDGSGTDARPVRPSKTGTVLRECTRAGPGDRAAGAVVRTERGDFTPAGWTVDVPPGWRAPWLVHTTPNGTAPWAERIDPDGDAPASDVAKGDSCGIVGHTRAGPADASTLGDESGGATPRGRTGAAAWAGVSTLNNPRRKAGRMYLPLQEGVQTGVVDLAGWFVAVGGLAAVAAWLARLYR